MSAHELDRLIGTALTDPVFCRDLLNPYRQEIIVSFDLSREEQSVVLGIQAHSLSEFAQNLYRWMQEQAYRRLNGSHQVPWDLLGSD